MTEVPSIIIRRATTPAELESAFAIRRRVFLDEQKVPREEEFDDDDRTAIHVVAWLGDEATATGRLIIHPDHARIGRMAVLAPHRGRGIGRAVLEALLGYARARNVRRVFLHAQVHAIGFYEAAGFRAAGDVFEEAGIPHRSMELDLSAGATPA
jgi:predicted GNAT family N-acyltransferase